MVRSAGAKQAQQSASWHSKMGRSGRVGLGVSAASRLLGLGLFSLGLGLVSIGNHPVDGPYGAGNRESPIFLSGPKPVQAQESETVYRPIPLKIGTSIEDSLSEKDIPTGKGSFARDYSIELQKGDQIAIDLLSERFDTVVTLMTPNGTTVGENDDGPDGGTNSLLFMRIPQTGSYVVRVQAFGQAKGGDFTLKLTMLEAMEK